MGILYRGELVAFAIIAFAAATLCLSLALSETRIEWSAFYWGFFLNAILFAVGLLIRGREILARFSVTFFALGLYPLFSSVQALVFSLQFPLHRPLIDDQLFALDAWVGYDWAAAVEWLAQYPVLAQVLAYAYASSLGQLLVLLLLLGLTGRTARLHHLMVTGMLSAVILCAFWIIWPSFGPSAYLTPDPAAVAGASLIVTPDYGAQLMHLAEHGQDTIHRHKILGTVAFPSFHIVLAALAVWFARGTVLFWPLAAINLLVIPATAIHGGHHLVDLPAGVVLFALSCVLARQLLGAGLPRIARHSHAPA